VAALTPFGSFATISVGEKLSMSSTVLPSATTPGRVPKPWPCKNRSPF
jgi:hypothetical protein